MRHKLRSITLFFFTFFGGILLLKIIFYVFISGRSLNLENEIADTAFIAIFISFCLVLLNGYRFDVKG